MTPPRLRPLLLACDGDLKQAVELYSWNARLASACFLPLAHCEILLRNALDTELRHHFREEERGIPWFLQRACGLRAEEQDEISAVRNRLQREGKPDSRDQIIAGLTFGFWVKLLGKRYIQLWKDVLHKAFFDSGTQKRPSVQEVRLLTNGLRAFRNRIAHHDYMRDHNIPALMEDIFKLVEYISPEYAEWMREPEQCDWSTRWGERPRTLANTVIIAAGHGEWEAYCSQSAYICEEDRFFREETDHIAFYSHHRIHRQIPRIRHVFDSVEWSLSNADELQNSPDKNEKKLARIIQWSFSPQGREILTEKISEGSRKKVILLSRMRDQNIGPDGHIVLPRDIPHYRKGHDRGFTQRQRYVPLHRLGKAESTDDLFQI